MSTPPPNMSNLRPPVDGFSLAVCSVLNYATCDYRSNIIIYLESPSLICFHYITFVGLRRQLKAVHIQACTVKPCWSNRYFINRKIDLHLLTSSPPSFRQNKFLLDFQHPFDFLEQRCIFVSDPFLTVHVT